MLLANIQDVLNVIRFDDIEDVKDSIANALECATADLSNYLRTDFDLKQNTDSFFVEQAIPAGSIYQAGFLLSNGFVLAHTVSTPFYIRRAATYTDLVAAPIDISASCRTSYEAGTVSYSGDTLMSQHIEIGYWSGFGADEFDDTVYDQTRVPNWLKQAAIVKSIMHLDTVSPTLRHESKEDVDLTKLENQYNNLVRTKMRYWPQLQKPTA